MWSYYGAKTNIAHLYPPPKYGKIIEPFAGTARYSLKYWDREILLVDKYEVLINIWKWLQKCSPNDLLKLRKKWKIGDRIDEIKFDCDEQKNLLGFLITTAEAPRNQVTSWIGDPTRDRINYSITRIANNLHKIRHWKIDCKDFKEIENQQATWFIDAPYEKGGHSYKHSNKKIHFGDLAQWCKERVGQIIVCESGQASWLNFIPLAKQKIRTGFQKEIFWTNLPTSFNVEQKELFT